MDFQVGILHVISGINMGITNQIRSVQGCLHRMATSWKGYCSRSDNRKQESDSTDVATRISGTDSSMTSPLSTTTSSSPSSARMAFSTPFLDGLQRSFSVTPLRADCLKLDFDTPPQDNRLDFDTVTPLHVNRLDFDVDTLPQANRLDFGTVTPPHVNRPDFDVDTPPQANRLDFDVVTPPHVNRLDFDTVTPPHVNRPDFDVDTPPQASRLDFDVDTLPQVNRLDFDVDTPPQEANLLDFDSVTPLQANRRRLNSVNGRRLVSIFDSTSPLRMLTPTCNFLTSATADETTPVGHHTMDSAGYTPLMMPRINHLEMRNKFNRRQDQTVPTTALFRKMNPQSDDEEDLPIHSNFSADEFNHSSPAQKLFNYPRDERSVSRARKGSQDQQNSIQKTIADMTACRFQEEFGHKKVIGSGSFGTVYRCTELSTKLTFAVKVSKNAVTQSDLNEVSTHQTIEDHPHIVRYISSWVEMDHMHTQLEFCNGGSLNSILEQQRSNNSRMGSSDLEILLAHTSAGQSQIHALNLAHLDVKPDNILVIFPTTGDGVNKSNLAGVVYKLGDFGHVVSIYSRYIEDGDSRYLAPELMNDDYRHLAKADIFSLGMTLHEAGSGLAMPKNGRIWREFRHDMAAPLEQASPMFNEILLNMLSSDPQKRITSEELHARSSQLGSNTASGESHGIQVPSLTTPVSYCHRSGSRFCDASPLPLDEEPDHLDKTLEFLQQAPSLMYPQYWRKPGAC